MESLSTPIFLQIINALGIGVMVFDQHKRLVVWNQWLAKHSGLAADQICGKTFEQLFANLRGSRVDNAINSALLQGFPAFLSQSLNQSPFDLYARSSHSLSASLIQQSINVVPLKSDSGERYVMLQISDVTAAVQRETALRRQADEQTQSSLQDALTGIANRRRFNEKLEQEFGRCQRENSPLSLLMLDIDYFRRYNDAFGRQQGDLCLSQIARNIKRSLRKPADLVARYGGEEFAVILPDTNSSNARKYAERLMVMTAELALPHPTSDVSEQVTLSIGIATQDSNSAGDPTSLIMMADLALYRAKQEGRARISLHSNTPGAS